MLFKLPIIIISFLFPVGIRQSESRKTHGPHSCGTDDFREKLRHGNNFAISRILHRRADISTSGVMDRHVAVYSHAKMTDWFFYYMLQMPRLFMISAERDFLGCQRRKMTSYYILALFLDYNGQETISRLLSMRPER